jgi:DNA sulfur modification protein DndD
MILDKIKIKNFRQYRDVEIDFAKEHNNNFTIIQGDNGTGKTTLLNAFSWCLYGEEIHDYGDKTSLGYCNNKSAFLAEENEEITVQVEIHFIHEDKTLIFSRKKFYQKKNNKVEAKLGRTVFEIFNQVDSDIKHNENNAYLIEQLIPKDISEYFFFDGAILQKYFEDNSSKRIKKSIFEISQVNLIKNMETNITKLINKYIGDLNTKDKKLAEIRRKLEDYNKSIENYEEQLNETKKEVSNAEENLKEVNSKLLEMDSERINDLVNERTSLENSIKRLSEKIKNKEVERKKYVIKMYPILFSYEYFNKFLKISDDSREKGRLPPLYRKQFIEDLLENNECICGVDLNLNKKSKKTLESILNNASEDLDYHNITEAVIKVKDLLIEIEEFKSKLTSIKKNLVELHEEHDKKVAREREISLILKDDAGKEIKTLEEERDSLNIIIKNGNRKEGQLEEKIKNVNEEKKNVAQQINEADRLDKEVELIDKKISKSEIVKENVKILNGQFSDSILKKIEELTKKHFLKIIWKDNEYKDLEIDGNYEIFIENRLGQKERPGDLSDGEKLIVGLCFMLGLHNITRFDLPIIMDTPLGILGKNNKLNLAKSFPQLASDKQVVLLVTDTEYDKNFRDNLSNVGKEYYIEWDSSDDGKESKVILNGKN